MKKKRELYSQAPRSHCGSTLLCPLAPMLTSQSTMYRTFPRFTNSPGSTSSVGGKNKNLVAGANLGGGVAYKFQPIDVAGAAANQAVLFRADNPADQNRQLRGSSRATVFVFASKRAIPKSSTVQLTSSLRVWLGEEFSSLQRCKACS